MTIAVAVYVAGALLALWRTDADWPIRLGIAAIWPLGPAAFVVTVCLLLAASLIAFPLVGAAVVALALALWLLAW